MDENIELQDSQNLDEELDLDLEDDQGEASPTADDDVEALKQRLADIEAKNKRLYARLKKGEQKTEKPVNKPSTEVVDEDIRKDVAELKMERIKRQFGYEHGLSPEEVDAVFKINPNPSKETLEDPFVKGGLKAIRAKNAVENATPSSSRRSPSINGKTLAEMTKEERAKNWSQVIAKSVGR